MQTFDSRRLRHQRQMDQRLTADHRQLARLIAGLVTRAATARDAKGEAIIPATRASRDALKAAVWESVLKPYYVGSGTDPLKGPTPQSPYAALLVDGITTATRIQAERQTAIVKRLCKDETVLAWLTGPRNVLAVREMAHASVYGRITELTAINVGQPFTPQPERGSGRIVDVSRLVSPKGMYEPFHQFVDPNGYRLSDRIWRTSIDVRSRVDRLMDYEIANGTSAVGIANMLEPFLTPTALQQRTKKPYGSEGSYAARRLARTEITAAAGRATVNSTAANPFVERLQWRLSGSHPKIDICDQYARGGPNGDGIYAIGSLPPYPPHPHCLCSILPVPTGSTADLVQTLRADIQAARGNLIDAASGGNAQRARALQGILNPDYLTRAMLNGNLEEAVQAAANQAATMKVRAPRVAKPKAAAAAAPTEVKRMRPSLYDEFDKLRDPRSWDTFTSLSGEPDDDAIMVVRDYREKARAYIEQKQLLARSVQTHGMAGKHRFQSFDLEGVTVYYDQATERAAVDTLIKLYAEDRQGQQMPARMWEANKKVYLVAERNSKDAYWEKKYNMPSFQSAATAGDGDIVIYGGIPGDARILAHESGHNLATELYKDTTPKAKSDYAKAMADPNEQPVTPYARNSPSEDFAETANWYVTHYEELREKHPLRFSVFDAIIRGLSRG